MNRNQEKKVAQLKVILRLRDKQIRVLTLHLKFGAFIHWRKFVEDVRHRNRLLRFKDRVILSAAERNVENVGSPKISTETENPNSNKPSSFLLSLIENQGTKNSPNNKMISCVDSPRRHSFSHPNMQYANPISPPKSPNSNISTFNGQSSPRKPQSPVHNHYGSHYSSSLIVAEYIYLNWLNTFDRRRKVGDELLPEDINRYKQKRKETTSPNDCTTSATTSPRSSSPYSPYSPRSPFGSSSPFAFERYSPRINDKNEKELSQKSFYFHNNNFILKSRIELSVEKAIHSKLSVIVSIFRNYRKRYLQEKLLIFGLSDFFNKWKLFCNDKKLLDTKLPLGLKLLISLSHTALWNVYKRYCSAQHLFFPGKMTKITTIKDTAKRLNMEFSSVGYCSTASSPSISPKTSLTRISLRDPSTTENIIRNSSPNLPLTSSTTASSSSTASNSAFYSYLSLLLQNNNSFTSQYPQLPRYQIKCMSFDELWNLLTDCKVVPITIGKRKLSSMIKELVDSSSSDPSLESKDDQYEKGCHEVLVQNFTLKYSKKAESLTPISNKARKSPSLISFELFAKVLWTLTSELLEVNETVQYIDTIQSLLLSHPKTALSKYNTIVSKGEWNKFLSQFR